MPSWQRGQVLPPSELGAPVPCWPPAAPDPAKPPDPRERLPVPEAPPAACVCFVPAAESDAATFFLREGFVGAAATSGKPFLSGQA